MKLYLTRTDFREDGIFGELRDDKDKIIAYTLEHSYDKKPKLYNGTFKCIRGMHRLASMTSSFETFEITGVSGHVNILFHTGNWNNDSEGCVLLGRNIDRLTKPDMWMLLESRKAFEDFKIVTYGLNEFDLIVD